MLARSGTNKVYRKSSFRFKDKFPAINEIEIYTENVSLDDFVKNSMMFNATLRQLEIIGEASNRLSEQLLQNNTDIPWARIIGLRNLVVHEYFGIDDITIWNVIKINYFIY